MKRTLRTLLVFVLSLAISTSFSVHSLAMQALSIGDAPVVLTEGDLWYYNFETGESRYESYGTFENTRAVQKRQPYCPPNVLKALETADIARGVMGDHVGVWAHAYPYCAVGMIEFYADLNDDGIFDASECVGMGTAFLVAEDIILTAAHCIWNDAYSDCTRKILFYPAMNGFNDSYRTTYSTYVVYTLIPSAYKNSQDETQDWALCRIKHDRGNTFGWFGLSSSAGIVIGSNVSLSGYPGNEQGHPAVTYGYQYKSTGTVTSKMGYELVSTNYVRSGYSGGPIYDSDGIVYGILSGSLEPGNGIINSVSTCFPNAVYNRIIQECDAAAERWS